jgi:hypothetical protein
MSAHPKSPKGQCPVCGRTYRLKTDGTLRAHWARLPDGTAAPGLNDCTGTDQKPKATP